MRRLLAGVLLGSVALALPQHALAFDYAAPAVPPDLRAGATAPGVGGDLAAEPPSLSAGYTAGADNPQSDPASPAYVPRNQWDDGEGGCALWDWDVC